MSEFSLVTATAFSATVAVCLVAATVATFAPWTATYE